MKLFLLFSMVFLIKHAVADDQWIDPHDMNTNAKEKYVNPSTLKKSSGTLAPMNSGDCSDSEVCFSHLRRIISVLMNSAHIDRRDPATYYGNIRFNINPDDFDFLINFGKEGVAFDKLRKLDTVFSESFKRAFISEYLDEIESYQLKLYSVVVNMQNLWILGTVFLLYVIYQLFKNNFSFSYILKYLIIMIFICDFGFRYQYLLEEAEEHNANIHYSSICDPAKMTWGQWTKFWLSRKDCERKTVTPLDAFLYQVKNLIIIPMHAFGTGMGGFGYNLFTNLPWGLNLIMWPLMLIFVLILVVFAMVICTGQSIEFNVFHLIKLKFGGSRPAQNENMLTGSTVERIMDRVLHRPMVQNINVAVSSGENRETREDDSNNGTSSDKIKSISNTECAVVPTDKNPEMDKANAREVCLGENRNTSSVSEDIHNTETSSHKSKTTTSYVRLTENLSSPNLPVEGNSNECEPPKSKNNFNDINLDKNITET